MTGSRLPLSRGSRRRHRAAASLSVGSPLLPTLLLSLLGEIDTAGVVGRGVLHAVAEDSGVLNCSRRVLNCSRRDLVALGCLPEAG